MQEDIYQKDFANTWLRYPSLQPKQGLKGMKIVMYHYVREAQNALPHFNFLHIDDFRRQLDYFQEEAGILSPAAVFTALQSGESPQGYLLSFDDGLKDHYDFVLPELLQRGLSAFFFVSTGWYVHQKMLAVHRIHLLLGRFGGIQILSLLQEIVQPAMISPEQQAHFEKNTYPNQQNDEASLSVKQLLNFFIKNEYLPEVLDALFDKTGMDEQSEGGQLYLSKAEIKKMHDAGMVIGSHTENHPVLSKLSFEEQQKEIQQAAAYFTSGFSIGQPTSFCYPYGYAGTYNDDTLKALAGNGFECAFVVDARDATNADFRQQPLLLPRYDCNMFPYGKIYRQG